MTVTERGTTHIPRHPSNRAFIQQMKAWGWTEGKTDGTWQVMWSPPIGPQVKTKVRPATQHDANPTRVFLEVYRLTTQGDAELFWRGPSAQWLKMIGDARDRAEREKEEAYDRTLTSAQRRADEAARSSVPTPEVPEQKEVPVPKLRQVRSGPSAKEVLDVLSHHDAPMSASAIAERLGLDITEDRIAKDITNRCGYLVEHGLATRVMRGVYRVGGQGKSVAARVQHDGIHQGASGDPIRPPTAVPQQSPPPAATVTKVAESVDDTIEAILDLLFPQGFKATHLRYIAPWVESTKRMVEEVSHG